MAYHVGAPGLSARRVKAECKLVGQMANYLDEMNPDSARSSAHAQDYLRRRVTASAPLRWAETPEKRLGWVQMFWRWISLASAADLVLSLVLLLLPLFLIFAARLRWKEIHDVADTAAQPANITGLWSHEDDKGLQNHLASITRVKPGWMRWLLLRLVLWGAGFVTRVQTHGKLGGIPGIFFAHWTLFDKGRKLLFLSNYSGGWDSYLDDFVDLASWGLTPIWSNTIGFPKTRLLFAGGSRDRDAFKRFVRRSQVESLVWYPAYPNLTVDNVNRNSAIRNGLFRELDSDGQRRWLEFF